MTPMTADVKEIIISYESRSDAEKALLSGLLDDWAVGFDVELAPVGFGLAIGLVGLYCTLLMLAATSKTEPAPNS
jgi:hypothetical protein